MKIYYIKVEKENSNSAGSKAPLDLYSVLEELKYEKIGFPQFPNNQAKMIKKIWLLFVGWRNWKKLMKRVDRNSIVIYQHPMYGNRLIKRFIPIIRKRKNIRFVAIIHDLDSLRGNVVGVVERSIKTNKLADNDVLKQFDLLICHNEHMREYLINQGFNSNNIIELEIFDYLSPVSKVEHNKNEIPSLVIAGNLSINKSGYIYKIKKNGYNMNLILHLYGKNYDKEQIQENLIYHGTFSPDELPAVLEGDFGLVWDGDSAETCSGNTGEYLKYNNPHKTSLYIAAGIPVIVWSQAAIADFVIENGVGITIDSLYEIEEKIKIINKEKYKKMLLNTQIIGKRIRTGYYTKTALEKALIKLRQTL